MSSPTTGEWVLYTVYMTAVTWAMAVLSQVDIPMTFAMVRKTGYMNTAANERMANLGYSIVILTLHLIFIGFALYYKENWTSGDLDSRYQAILALVSLVLANNVIGWIGKVVYFYNLHKSMGNAGDKDVTVKEWKAQVASAKSNQLAMFVGLVQGMCVIGFIVICLVFVSGGYTSSEATTGFVNQMLLASGSLILINYAISNMWDIDDNLPYGITYTSEGWRITGIEKPAELSWNKAPVKPDTETVQLRNALAGDTGKIKLHTVVPANAKFDPNLYKKNKETVFQSGHLEASQLSDPDAIVQAHYLEHMRTNPNFEKTLGHDPSAVSFVENKDGIHVVSAAPLSLAARRSAFSELLTAKTRPDMNADPTIASLLLSGVTTGVAMRSPVMGKVLNTYYMKHDIWGFARGCATWTLFRTETSIPFVLFMYAFYIYFFMNSQLATVAWIITCFPALLGSLPSVTGYFWENFTYMFFYGWMLIVLATKVAPSGYWFIEEPDAWNSVSSTLVNATTGVVTTDMEESAHLMGVSIASLTVTLISVLATARRVLWLAYVNKSA